MVYKLDFKTNLSHSFTHPINGMTVKIDIKFNKKNNYYYMDVFILFEKEYVRIFAGKTLTTGVNLFFQYRQFNLGDFRIIPKTTNNFDKIPQAETIVNNYFIVWED